MWGNFVEILFQAKFLWKVTKSQEFRRNSFALLLHYTLPHLMRRAKAASFCQALTASLESFVHQTLKDGQIKCIHRIVCHVRDVLAVLPTGLGKRAIYQLIPKVLFRMGRSANATSKTIAELLVFCRLTKWNGTFTKWHASRIKIGFLASETYSLRTKQEDAFYKINHIFLGRTAQLCM